MKVLITTHPIYSHLVPLIPLAILLQKQGHNVVFASSLEVIKWLSKIGFKTLEGEPVWENDSEILSIQQNQMNYLGEDHGKYVIQNLFIRTIARRSLKLMESVINTWKPDVVISESTEFAGRLIAESKSIPFVSVSYGMEFGSFFGKYFIKNSLDELRTKLSLDSDPEFLLLNGGLSLCLCPSIYHPEYIPLSRQALFFRPELSDNILEINKPQWINELPDKPVIYITLGNAFSQIHNYLEKIVDSINDKRFQLIVSVGFGASTKQILSINSEIIVEQYIPNSELFSYCDAIVSHAGYGTIISSLITGKPMVLLSLGADHFFNSKRCEELGVALSIHINNFSGKSVKDSLNIILESLEFKKAATKMKHEIEKTNELKYSITLIEKLVHD